MELVTAKVAEWKFIRHERQPLARDLVRKAQLFGLSTLSDKACALLGGGSVLLLVLEIGRAHV